MAKAGERVSEYVLEDRLGSGAFGEVWRARHHAWHTTVVAVKLPHDGQLIRQLQREGLTVQGLDHPNVVKPLGFDPHADPPYLVSEFVEGGSLRGPITRREATPARAVAIVRDVLAGLAYAHGRGLVHRDVKPENVLLTRDGTAKLADFGLGQSSAAGSAGGANGAAGPASVIYTMSLEGDRAAAVAGTLDYMSPEQRAGGPVDARSDLYAVAVVLFELLTGERPAGHDTPGDLNPAVPAYLNDVFRRGYARVDRRFATAAEFAAALGVVPPPLSAGKPCPAGAVPPSLAPAPLAVPPLTPSPLTPLPLTPLPLTPASRTAKSKACPRCRRDVVAGDQFCMHCGVQIAATVRRCVRCGAYPDAGDEFCIRCGDAVTAGRASVNRLG